MLQQTDQGATSPLTHTISLCHCEANTVQSSCTLQERQIPPEKKKKLYLNNFAVFGTISSILTKFYYPCHACAKASARCSVAPYRSKAVNQSRDRWIQIHHISGSKLEGGDTNLQQDANNQKTSSIIKPIQPIQIDPNIMSMAWSQPKTSPVGAAAYGHLGMQVNASVTWCYEGSAEYDRILALSIAAPVVLPASQVQRP